MSIGTDYALLNSICMFSISIGTGCAWLHSICMYCISKISNRALLHSICMYSISIGSYCTFTCVHSVSIGTDYALLHRTYMHSISIGNHRRANGTIKDIGLIIVSTPRYCTHSWLNSLWYVLVTDWCPSYRVCGTCVHTIPKHHHSWNWRPIWLLLSA